MRIREQLFAQNRFWADSIKKINPTYFEVLSRQQSPKFFWIGCSDSRVPVTCRHLLDCPKTNLALARARVCVTHRQTCSWALLLAKCLSTATLQTSSTTATSTACQSFSTPSRSSRSSISSSVATMAAVVFAYARKSRDQKFFLIIAVSLFQGCLWTHKARPDRQLAPTHQGRVHPL